MNTKEFVWPEGEELVFIRPPIEEYNGKLDNYYSPHLFPEIQKIKENWKIIRDEILSYEKSNGNLTGTSVKSGAGVYGGEWTVKYLKSFMLEYKGNKKLFPKTSEIIDSIPNIVFSAVSILNPNSHILPHYGDTNGIVRGHVGLVIPAPTPTIAMKVGDEIRGWEEGELLCFINVQKHEVWNKTDQRRYILMFDFVPKVLEHRKLEICSKGLGSQSFNYLFTRIGLLKYTPIWFHNILAAIFTQIWKVYLIIFSKKN